MSYVNNPSKKRSNPPLWLFVLIGVLTLVTIVLIVGVLVYVFLIRTRNGDKATHYNKMEMDLSPTYHRRPDSERSDASHGGFIAN